MVTLPTATTLKLKHEAKRKALEGGMQDVMELLAQIEKASETSGTVSWKAVKLISVDGTPSSAESLHQLSAKGISMLKNLAIITAEDELCKETDGERMKREQMLSETGVWRSIKDLFGKVFH